jgi:hypothetical protein
VGIAGRLQPLTKIDNDPLQLSRDTPGLCASSIGIVQPADAFGAISLPPCAEPFARAIQDATDVCNGLTGQAHLDSLMTIRKFIIHNSLLCSSLAVAA